MPQEEQQRSLLRAEVDGVKTSRLDPLVPKLGKRRLIRRLLL
jgi:hypothetical protein